MQRTREGTDRKDCRCRDRRDQQCTCKEDGSGGIRHGIESGVTMVTQGFRDATLYHMSAKDTLHDVGITGITTFSTGIAFDILSRPVQALVRKFRGTVGISGCSEAAEGAGKSAGGTSGGTQVPPANGTGSGNRFIKIIDGKVNGKIPLEDYEAICKKSIKNPSSDTMTLGKYFSENVDGVKIPACDSYTVKAGDTTYFDLGSSWEGIKETYGLTEKEMFNIFNVPALDDAVYAGKTIRFSHDPRAWGECATKDEWNYLKDKYKYSDLVKEGAYWYAIK